jgi:hypothetical protein
VIPTGASSTLPLTSIFTVTLLQYLQDRTLGTNIPMIGKHYQLPSLQKLAIAEISLHSRLPKKHE